MGTFAGIETMSWAEARREEQREREEDAAGAGEWRYLLSVDLGKQADYTAAVLIDRHAFPATEADALGPTYAVPWVKRWPLHTRYTEIRDRLVRVVTRPELAGRVALALDGTGVGEAVLEIFTLTPTPRGRILTELCAEVFTVVLHGGSEVKEDHEQGKLFVPKRELADTAQVLLQNSRLAVSPGCEHADLLRQELKAFRVSYTAAANMRFEAREGEHDDLVLALAQGLWVCEWVGGGPQVL